MPPLRLRRSALSALPTLLSLTKLVHVIPNQSTWSAATSGAPPIEPEDPPDSPAFWWKLGLSVVFVLSGGVFAGLTLALMGSDDLNLRVLSTSSSNPKERQAANKVLRLLSRGRHWVLVVLLLSNVIVNESLPIFLDDVLGGGLYAVIVSTTMIVIFGEIIPQAICVRYGLAIGGACAPMVWFFMILFSPIAWPTAKLLDYILGTDEGHTYKKAELKSFLQFHREGEEPLRDDEIAILNGVLSLNEKHAKEIMTPIKDCLTLPADKVLDHEAIDQILLSGFSRIPVHEPGQKDNFVGMLLVKRLITYNPDDEWPVSKFSLLPLPEAKPDINCFQALDYFQTGRAHLLLISETPGQKGGALGIVSLEDLIEEIIGEEIVDETDRYEDNHSKKIVKRSGPAAVMRGIIERRRVINAFSRRPSRSSTFPSAAQTPGPGAGGGASATANNTTDGILVQIDNGNLVAEPVGFSGAGNDATEGGQESVTLDPSNRLVIGPEVLNGLSGANGDSNDDGKGKAAGTEAAAASGAMSPIAETSPVESTSGPTQVQSKAETETETEAANETPGTNDLLEVPPTTTGGAASEGNGTGNGDASADSAGTSINGSGTTTPQEGEGNDDGEGEGETQALLGGENKNAGTGSGNGNGNGNGGTASKKKKKGKKGKKDRTESSGPGLRSVIEASEKSTTRGRLLSDICDEVVKEKEKEQDDDDDDDGIPDMDSYVNPLHGQRPAQSKPPAQSPSHTHTQTQAQTRINLEYPFESHDEFESACKGFINKYDQQTEKALGERGGPVGAGAKLEGRTNGGWEWRESKNIPHQGYMYRRVIRWLDHNNDHSANIDNIDINSAVAPVSAPELGSYSDNRIESPTAQEKLEEAEAEEEEEEMMEEEEDVAIAPLLISASAQQQPRNSTSTGAEEESALAVRVGAEARAAALMRRVDVEQYIVHSKTYGTVMFCFRAWDKTGAPLPISQLLQLLFLRNTPGDSAFGQSSSKAGDTILLSPDSPFPLIQSTEHPSTGELVFSIHPCRISEAVAEILQVEVSGMWDRAIQYEGGLGELDKDKDKDMVEGEGEARAKWERVTWLQVFMMLTNKVVDLTYP